jgi:hypothetical protein
LAREISKLVFGFNPRAMKIEAWHSWTLGGKAADGGQQR